MTDHAEPRPGNSRADLTSAAADPPPQHGPTRPADDFGRPDADTTARALAVVDVAVSHPDLNGGEPATLWIGVAHTDVARPGTILDLPGLGLDGAPARWLVERASPARVVLSVVDAPPDDAAPVAPSPAVFPGAGAGPYDSAEQVRAELAAAAAGMPVAEPLGAATMIGRALLSRGITSTSYEATVLGDLAAGLDREAALVVAGWIERAYQAGAVGGGQ